ncbi:MAG: hypothetical protein WCO09_00965 [bacterium]
MNSTNQSLYKKIGILISVVAVLAVFIVTFAEEKPSPATVSVASNTAVQGNDTSVQSTSQEPAVNVFNKTTSNSSTSKTTKKVTKSSNLTATRSTTYSDSEERDEEGFWVKPSTSANTQTAPIATAQTQTPTQSQTPPPVATTKKYLYKNGTYTADGPYNTPEGQVAISVTITITNDVITDANVTSVSGDNTSIRYQNKFISGYKQYVIGKSVDSVQLSNVSGSSLTPAGFNNAFASIKVQARA